MTLAAAILAGMGDVIQYVRTPLALAALVFLVGAPLVRQILRRKGKPNEDTRAVIRYVFGIGLVFGVLAIAAFVYTAGFNREIRISGTVRDESGAGLPFVAVRIAGGDGGVTDDAGNFAFTIPDSRAANGYVAEVFRENYELQRVNLDGRYPQPFTVTLKKRKVATDRVLTLPSAMTLRHNLGVPQVEVSLSFSNPYPSPVTVTDIGITLIAPGGAPVPMQMESVSIAPGVFGPPLPIWKMEKGDAVTLGYSFFNADLRFVELQQKIGVEVLPKSGTVRGPDPAAKLLSEPLVKELREYATARFVWAPGQWELRASYQVEGERPQASATFTLTDADVRKMKAIFDHYPAGLGAIPAWRFWQSGDVNPAVNVLLTGK